ncbi:hypothetical protein [Streptomyces sp. NPDC051909]|uniref:hypothetical protein n=1 Tax=Streptomyces sp. NPDC051909 TaxID=3154944 RepID=UPI003436F8A1
MPTAGHLVGPVGTAGELPSRRHLLTYRQPLRAALVSLGEGVHALLADCDRADLELVVRGSRHAEFAALLRQCL